MTASAATHWPLPSHMRFLFAFATLLALCALGPHWAKAQDEPPATGITIEGQFGGAALRFHARSSPSLADRIKLQELVELQLRADLLRASNRNWEIPLAIAALGACALIAGGVLFQQAWARDEYSVPMDRAGLVLMPTGAAIVLAATPIAIVRLARAFRLRRVERALAMVSAR